MKRSTWQYYGVKLIYQASIAGAPIPGRVDEDYSDANTFYEESVVLVHAQSFDQAYTIAEQKSKDHTPIYQNQYGQTVEWKLVDAIDCYVIGEQIANGTEIYSSITPVDKMTVPAQYLMQKYQYNNEDDSWNDMYHQRCVHLQRVLNYEKFSKWRSTP